MLTNNDIIKAVRQRAYIDFHNQVEYAEYLGVSVAFINSVIRGKKKPSKKVLDDLGVEKVRTVTYQYIEK